MLFTIQFDAKFHWIVSGDILSNRWIPPITSTDGRYTYDRRLIDGDIIPFRRRPESSSSSNAATPSSGSNTTAPSPTFPLSPTSASSPTPPPLPSASLLYVREILTRIAHMMGAAGHAEYDYWEDDYDESVYATEAEEEETSNPTLQVMEWLDKVKPSRIDDSGVRP